MNLKEILILTYLLIAGNILYSQVGINTSTPLGILHIDPNGDTRQSGTIIQNDADDILIDKTKGYVGIGRANPQYRLDIKTVGTQSSPIPGFRMQDGKQGEGMVLLCNALGQAYWGTAPSSELTTIPGGTGGMTLSGTNTVNYLGYSFQLKTK